MAECQPRARALREFTKHLPPVEAWQLERETFLWAGTEPTAPTAYAYHCVSLLHYLEALHSTPQTPRHPVTQLPWLPPDVLHGRQSVAAEASQSTHRRRWDTLRTLRDVKLVVPDDVQGGMRCRKCRSNDLLVETHQTRAADEGMTQFVTCRACGARW